MKSMKKDPKNNQSRRKKNFDQIKKKVLLTKAYFFKSKRFTSGLAKLSTEFSRENSGEEKRRKKSFQNLLMNLRTSANEFVIESPPSIIKQRKIVMSEIASPNPNASLNKKPAEDVSSPTPHAVS
jgi:hypothetical protein